MPDSRLIALGVTLLLLASGLTLALLFGRRALRLARQPHARPTLREVAALTLLWGVFVALFMWPELGPARSALDSTWSGGGIEYERLSGIIIPIEIGLTRYGHIPTWNPYMNTGVPLLNNAFSYLYNPFASLPPLLLGAVQGVKVSVAIALWFAALGTWALAKALGVGTVGRVLAGGLYMASGGIAGKFYPGHIQLVISLTWVPLVLAGLWWTLRTPSRWAVALLAVSFALLFFSGNIYYTLHTLVCAAPITLLHVVERAEGRWRLRGERLRRVLAGGVFAFGLAALQFVPLWMVRGSIDHFGVQFDDSLQLVDRYSLEQAALNFIYPWPGWLLFERPDLEIHTMLVGVDYNYIGLVPFLLIAMGAAALLSANARRRIPKRAAFSALTLAVVMMIWGAAQSGPLQWLYANIDLLSEFRYMGRAHAIAGLWWILLGCMALDALWQVIGASEQGARYESARLARSLTIGVALWGGYLLYSAQPDTTRLALAGGSLERLRFFDTIRFLSMADALAALWFVVLAAPLADTALLALAHGLRRAWARGLGLGWALYGRRLAHVGLLFLACVALADVFSSNSGLYWYAQRFADHLNLYQYIRARDPQTPIPDVNEPQTQHLMFQSYYSEVRNRELDEGWTPNPVPGLFPFGAGLADHDLARWALGFSVDLPDFQNYVFRAQQCVTSGEGRLAGPDSNADCDFVGVMPAMLYELPSALPYAYIAPSYMLAYRSNEIARANVLLPTTIEHAQDTITIQATMPAPAPPEVTPPGLPDYYLVVTETHFPGWRAFVDGVPVETVSAYRYIAIPMLAGTHTYTLRYQPPGLAAGALIFVITLAALGLYVRGERREATPFAGPLPDFREGEKGRSGDGA
ncbi:MAG: hypothetical protein HXY40_13320 [Chloroflexi bacterium]|nr:hypothetical protein [Chloroflexota bacterium]